MMVNHLIYFMKQFALVNGKVVTEKGIKEAVVLVKNGKIKAVARKLPKGLKVPVIDIKGMHVLPGLIDAHVHFRTPGMEQKEDWTTGSKAALAGGVTTVFDMPNTSPPTVSAALLKQKRDLVKRKALVNYGFFIGATPDNLKKIVKIKNVAGIKLYMGSSTGSLLVCEKKALEEFFAKAKMLAIHAENEACILEGKEKYKNSKRPDVHNLIRHPDCAYEAVKEVLHMAKKFGTRVHICHMSTDKEVAAVKKFKNKKVTAEVTPHHLFLTDKDYKMYGNFIKVNPPVRGLIDQVSLWEGIKKGWIDIIATDHAPHTKKEKMKPYADAPSGLPGVQTMLPLLLNAVNEKKLTLPDVVKLTSYNPAKIFKVKNKGSIAVGMDADLTVVNMRLPERVDEKHLWSKCGWSPFKDWVLKGWPVMTFVNGELMYQWGGRFGKSAGKEVKFG
jgi:dihydroorotase